MIICDACGKERMKGDIFNMLQLQWKSSRFGVDTGPQIVVSEHHLCEECTKKIDQKIKEMAHARKKEK